MHILGQRLEKWNHGLFIATVAFVCFKLILSSFEWAYPPDKSQHELLLATVSYLLALGVIVLPVLATTAFAIRNHAEFDISAQRSQTMHAALIQIQHDLVVDQAPLTATQIVTEMNRIAAITLRENTEWLEIFEVKQSEC
jgi:hypothetical protein